MLADGRFGRSLSAWKGFFIPFPPSFVGRMSDPTLGQIALRRFCAVLDRDARRQRGSQNGSPKAPGSVFAKDWTPAFPYDAQDVGAAPVGVAEQRRAEDRREGPRNVVTGSRASSHGGTSLRTKPYLWRAETVSSRAIEVVDPKSGLRPPTTGSWSLPDRHVPDLGRRAGPGRLPAHPTLNNPFSLPVSPG